MAKVAAGLQDDGDVHRRDDGVQSSDVLAALGALTVKGRLMRNSELGHPGYREELAGEPMQRVGEAWLDLLAYAGEELLSDGRIRRSIRRFLRPWTPVD